MQTAKTKGILLLLLLFTASLLLALGLALPRHTVSAQSGVATVGEQSYDSLSAAVNAAESGATITLTADTIESGTVTIPEGKVITLELNGCSVSVTGSTTIRNEGTLTITGNTSGVVETDAENAIENVGTLEIKGGYFKGGISNTGSVSISGGRFTKLVPASYLAENCSIQSYYTIGKRGYGINNNAPVAETTLDGTRYVFEKISTACDAAEGGTVTLIADAKQTNFITLGTPVTLDLNGHDITYTGTANIDQLIKVTGENVIITNSSQEESKLVNTFDAGSETYSVIYAEGASLTVENVTIESKGIGISATNSDMVVKNSTITSETGLGFGFFGGMTAEEAKTDTANYNTLTLENSSVSGYTFALSGNGTKHGTAIDIQNSTLTGTIGAGIYHPQVGTLTVGGADTKISGTSGIELRAGTLTVSGGEISATAKTFETIPNEAGTEHVDGSTIDGAAIAVSQHTTNLSIAVNITGGTFNGVKALYEEDLQDEESSNISMAVTGGTYEGGVESENVTGFISGGTFDSAVETAYVADDSVIYSKDGSNVVGTVEEAITAGAVAMVGNAAYTTLAAAVNAAAEGDTVTLIADAKVNPQVTISKAITVDLGSYTVENTGTSQVFVITASGVTIKGNGAVLKGQKVLSIANANNVSISGITLQGTSTGTGDYDETVRIYNAEVTLSDVDVDANMIGVRTWNGSKLTVQDGCTITSDYISLWALSGTEINVFNSTVNAEGDSASFYAIYVQGTVTATGSTLNADYIGVEANSGGQVTLDDTDIVVTYAKGTGIGIGTGIGTSVTVQNNSTITAAVDGGVGALVYGAYEAKEDSANVLQTAINADESTYTKLIVKNSTIEATSCAVMGNGSYHGTIFDITDSTLISNNGLAVYHPQYGNMTVQGTTQIQGSTGIEMRAGSLTIEDDSVKINATAEEFAQQANGNGQTLQGVAVGISQHSTNAPIKVTLTGGSYTTAAADGYAFYEIDLQDNVTDNVSASISGGTFEGGVESENVIGFISGGSFTVLPNEDLLGRGYAGVLYNGYYVVFEKAADTGALTVAKLAAQADIRTYSASLGFPWTELSDLYNDEEASQDQKDQIAPIFTAYNAVDAAESEGAVAVARLDALDAIDAYHTYLKGVKETKIGEIETYAAGGQDKAAVAVPTYILSAINGAVSEAEITSYVTAAKAEIDEIRAQRTELAGKFETISADITNVKNELQTAITTLGSDVSQEIDATSAEMLETLETQLGTVESNIKTEIAAIKTLLGTAADEAGNQTLFGKIGALEEKLTTVENNIKTAVTDAVTGVSEKVDGVIKTLKTVADSDDIAALTSSLAEIKGFVDGLESSVGTLGEGQETIVSILEKLQTAQTNLANSVAEYHGAVEAALTGENGIQAQLTALAAAVEALPDNTADIAALNELVTAVQTDVEKALESLGALGTSVGGVDGDLAALKEAVDKIADVQNGMNTALTTLAQTVQSGFDALSKQVTDLSAAVETIDAAIDKLPTASVDLSGIEELIGGLQADIDAANAALEGLDGEVSGLASLVGSLDGAQYSMNKALEAFEEAVTEQLTAIQTSLTALAADAGDNGAAIAVLQQKADEIAADLQSGNADLTDVAENVVSLQGALEALSADVSAQGGMTGPIIGLYVIVSVLVVLMAAVLVILLKKKN